VGLVPVPVAFRGLAILALGAAGASWWPESPELALAMLALASLFAFERTPLRVSTPEPVQWERTNRALLRRSRRAIRAGRAGACLRISDPTTLLGAAAIAGWVAGTVHWCGLLDAPEPVLWAAVVLGVLPSLTATRFHLPLSGAERLVLLARWAERIETDGDRPLAFCLLGGFAETGALVDARLVVHTDDAAGEIGIGEEVGAGGVRAIVVARADAHTPVIELPATPGRLRHLSLAARAEEAAPELDRSPLARPGLARAA
jgi:hypothetical protein